MNGAAAGLAPRGCASCSFVVRTFVPAGVPGVLPRAKARGLAGLAARRNISVALARQAGLMFEAARPFCEATRRRRRHVGQNVASVACSNAHGQSTANSSSASPVSTAALRRA